MNQRSIIFGLAIFLITNCSGKKNLDDNSESEKADTTFSSTLNTLPGPIKNDVGYIMDFEKIKGDLLSFTGTDGSLVWQLLVSSDNKFKIKKEGIHNPNYNQNTPTISQFGFVGTIATTEYSYILTLIFQGLIRLN